MATYALTPLSVWSGSAFVVIPGVTSIGGPNVEKETVEVTDMNSVGYKEYMVSPLADAGELEFSLNYTPSNAIHKYLFGHSVATGSIVDIWKMNFADNTSASFSGSMMSFGIKADNPASSVLTADLKVKITGKIVGLDA